MEKYLFFNQYNKGCRDRSNEKERFEVFNFLLRVYNLLKRNSMDI